MYALPNVLIQDLYDNIAKNNFPSWTLSIQVMTFDQAEKHPENPFDPTKNWKTDEYPLIPVGTLTLNENHKNYFINVEQIAFSPSNMVRGIEPSPDRVLQARLFAYPDAQLYRLGTNFAQIPVNACPFEVKTYRVNGPLNVGSNGEDAPDYYPNTFHGINSNDNRSFKQNVFNVSGDVDRVDTGNDDNFSPAKYFWEHEICADERKSIISNLITNLSRVEKRIQKKVLKRNLYTVNKKLGDKVKAGLHL
ncbi:catalase-like [Bradysia coprophila]|uniref:catalase-like n=1 Tax=Bradysia coprophila TaxID=38358 RepID=UPI00187DAA23|nr:catalase-like [Bradysia coprophila]